MKDKITLLTALLLSTTLAHAGPVSADTSKDAKFVAPVATDIWGAPILGGGAKANSEFVEGSLFLVYPLLETIGSGNTMEGSVLFAEPYLTWGEDGEIGASLGLGFRHLFSEQSVSDASSNTVAGLLTEGFYLGANAFIDYANSQADNDFWQIGLGVEAGTRYLTLRSNYYIPLSDDQTISRRTERTVTHRTNSTTNTVGSAPSVVGGQIVQNINRTTTTRRTTTTVTRTFEIFEEPLEGWDIELALLVPGLDQYCDVQIVGGYFSFEAERSHRDIEGWRLGIEARPVPAVVLHATWFDDDALYQDDWIAGVRLEIPLDSNWKDAFRPRRRHLAERLFEPVHRKNSSITTSGQVSEQVSTSTTTNGATVVSQSSNQIILGPAQTPPPPPPPDSGEETPPQGD
jgi:hypothetical protein